MVKINIQIHSCFAAFATGDKSLEIKVNKNFLKLKEKLEKIEKIEYKGHFIDEETSETIHHFEDNTYYDVKNPLKYATEEQMKERIDYFINLGFTLK